MNAADLNQLLSAFKNFGLSAPFKSRWSGIDAITGAKFPTGISIRMLLGKTLLTHPYNGAAGIDILSLAERADRRDARFVDDIDGDGRYFTVNRRGEATEFVVDGDKVHAKANFGRTCSVAAYRSQKLRHQIALIKVSN